MKGLKRIVTAMLAMAVAASLAVPAFADDGYTITINNETPGHTYEAYQIFAGDVNGSVLSNITWGSGIDAGKVASLDAKTEAYKLDGASAAEAEQFAKVIEGSLGEPTGYTSTLTNGKSYVISGLSAGYYLIKDRDNSLSDVDDSYTTFILKVVGNVEATPKSAVPSMFKKVKDVNDSTDAEMSDWQDSADHDMGDAVPFQLTGTVASNYDKYNAYYFAFHDVECEGLTFDATSVKAYVDGEVIDPMYYSVVTTDLADDCTFEIVFANLKAIKDAEGKEIVAAGSIITVEYTSKLNSNAVLGSEGNPNNARLEYSNNPNQIWDGEGKPETGLTPWDKVIVFTYKTVINKVDANGNALSGAEFTLEKKIGDDWESVSVVKNDAGTTFSFIGIDDGLYRLTETKTPTGYNTIEPIYFTVSATHDVLADDPKLTALTADQVDEAGVVLTTGQVATFTVSDDMKSMSTDIVNQKGATLPTTGGTGTLVLYLAGAVLLIGAGVALVVRRHVGDAE